MNKLARMKIAFVAPVFALASIISLLIVDPANAVAASEFAFNSTISHGPTNGS